MAKRTSRKDSKSVLDLEIIENSKSDPTKEVKTPSGFIIEEVQVDPHNVSRKLVNK